MESNSKIAILSFYSFTEIISPEEILFKILLAGKKKLIRGTIILSKEGFNGSISSSEEKVKFLMEEIIKLTSAQEVNIKINYSAAQPFEKFKVKLKEEIIAMNLGKIEVNKLKGEYIEPKDWDNFIKADDVILVDTRNDYEIEIGSFKGAINPNTETFKQFPDWAEQNKEILKNKKIAMYCTGGIRCEKSTSYLKKLGFDKVYHLKGGILQYLEDTKNKNNLWNGKCFVFDDRRAVSDDLLPAEGFWLERKTNHVQ